MHSTEYLFFFLFCAQGPQDQTTTFDKTQHCDLSSEMVCVHLLCVDPQSHRRALTCK